MHNATTLQQKSKSRVEKES